MVGNPSDSGLHLPRYLLVTKLRHPYDPFFDIHPLKGCLSLVLGGGVIIASDNVVRTLVGVPVKVEP